MLTCTHFACGLVLGKILPNWVSSGVAGFASHFLQDCWRHEETSDDIDKPNLFIVAIDIVVTCGMVCTLWRKRSIAPKELLGGVCAMMPDVEQVFPWNLSKTQPPRFVYPSH